MSYYNDERITFDQAHTIVKRYIREYGDRRSRVTCATVAESYDIEQSHHNLIRIADALDRELPVVRESGSKRKQYEIP